MFDRVREVGIHPRERLADAPDPRERSLVWAFWYVLRIPIGAVPPSLDAARLDIMHPALWGRAESVRALLRKAAEAAAPVVMGWLAGTVFGGGTTGLRHALLVMLGPLCAGGLVGLVALRTYLTDVATAAAYADRTGGAEARDDTTREARAPPARR